jgi:hypothetical protein
VNFSAHVELALAGSSDAFAIGATKRTVTTSTADIPRSGCSGLFSCIKYNLFSTWTWLKTNIYIICATKVVQKRKERKKKEVKTF